MEGTIDFKELGVDLTMTRDDEKKYYAEKIKLEGFWNQPGFLESKRFARYQKKVKEQIVSFFQKRVAGPSANNAFLCILSYFHTYYNIDEDLDDADSVRRGLCKEFGMPHYYSIEEPIKLYLRDKPAMELMKEFLRGETCSIGAREGDFDIHTIIEEEIQEASLNWLVLNHRWDDSVCEENYVIKTMPTEKTIPILLQWIIDWVNVDLWHFLRVKQDMVIKEKWKETDEQMRQKRMERVEEHIREKSQEAEESRKEAELLKGEIEKLNRTIEEKEERLKKNCEKFCDYERTIAKLEKQLNQQNEQEEREKEIQTEANEKDPETDDSCEITLNRDLRYAFLYEKGEISATLNSIKKEFPNALILTGTSSLSPSHIDVVVFMQKYIKHSTYYGIKTQCKARGIPYIHCKASNIEEIKRTICNSPNYR